jgi:cytoskeletal protein CcmA (bactofilin family)
MISGENKVSDNDFPTIIGPDAKFKGELSFEKGVKILGSFEGRISTKGNLVVASEGAIQADVEAGTITVEGEINGNISAEDLVELKNSARLQGDLRCERLIVVDGAHFVGHCDVGSVAAGEAAAPKKAPQPVQRPTPTQTPTDSNKTAD